MSKFLARLVFFAALSGVSLFAAPATAEAPSRTLFLIRHGMYDYHAGADDKTGNALTPLGREQAADVAAYLASLPLTFDSVTSSEFTRARETGDIIAAKLGLSCARDGLLNECSPTRSDHTAQLEQTVADAQLALAWARYTTPVAGGASTHELLVCHGNVIRWFVGRVFGAQPQPWGNLEIANCSVTVIQIRSDGMVRLQMFNAISHVPFDRQTWAGKGPGWPLPAQAKTK